MTEAPDALREAVLRETLHGLTANPRTLAPWLFYDEQGSQLFEQITELPEYYLTRTERAIFTANASEILAAASNHAAGSNASKPSARLTLLELGAGSATKTGILLQAAVARQGSVLYQPIDVSSTALDEAATSIATHIPGVLVEPQVANYLTEPFTLTRLPGERALALYIGSSIGNFSPQQATAILRNLRDHLEPGDSLLLGTDLAPSAQKSVATLEAAYDDATGITAAFNKNILTRLNRELDADFNLDRFAHCARWNAIESRIEMHLESLVPQTAHIEGQPFHFNQGETIHTENSYKFSDAALSTLFTSASFKPQHTWHDPARSFAVTLAEAI